MLVVHGSHTQAQVASVGRAPVDALADRQAKQRTANRREHRNAAVLYICLVRIHQGERMSFAMQLIFAVDAGVHGDDIAGNLIGWHNACAAQFVAQRSGGGMLVERGRIEQCLETGEVVAGTRMDGGKPLWCCEGMAIS